MTYRQTILGPLWIVLSPVLSAGLFTFVFGHVARLKTGHTPYFAFSYAGLLAWNLFANALQGAATSLTSNSALISKIYFPRLILPLATLGSTFVQLGISAVIMAVILGAYQIGVGVTLLLLPVWLFLGTVLAVGIGLILTAISVSYRDINNVTPSLIPLFLYLTPVAYPASQVPHSVRDIVLLNPVATIVEGCRACLIGGAQPTGWVVPYTIAMTIGFLLLGLITFTRLEWSFADVV